MPIYLVVSLANDASALDNALQRTVSASDRYRLQGNRGWFVRSELTSIELSNAIGITGPTWEGPALYASAIVAPISSYYGRGPTDMWEWLKSRMER
jgi:hypothetical protein